MTSSARPSVKSIRINEEKEEEKDELTNLLEDYVNYVGFKEGVSSRRFWMLGSMLYFGIFYGIYTISVYKVTGEEYLND